MSLPARRWVTLAVLAGAIVFAAWSCDRGADGGNGKKGLAPVEPWTKAMWALRLEGTWVLVDQHFPGRPQQPRWDRLRELTLRADGTFHLNLGHLERTGHLDVAHGAIRLHETLREGVDMVSKEPPSDPVLLQAWRPGTVSHVNELSIRELTADRLVVLEDDPQEVFGNHLPPKGKVRNTYRRKVAGDFGPLLGARITRFTPGDGRFAAAVAYSQNKLPTMEMSTTAGIKGTVVLTLGTGGDATLCVGVRESATFTASEYAPGGARRDARDTRRLLAWSGRWTTVAAGLALTLDRAVWNTCDLSSPESRAYPIPPVTIACAGLRANDRLPVDALACRLDGPLRQLDPLALNTADSHRAGPYTFQFEPMGRIHVEPGVPRLVLGAAGGLRIISGDDREASSPQVSFTREDVKLVEKDYEIERRPPAVR